MASKDELLERLDTFFGESANTDLIAHFMDNCVTVDVTANTDSAEGLRLYELFQQYSALMENILQHFILHEAEAGRSYALEEITRAILAEWAQPCGSFRYLCTAYLAGGMELDAFREIVCEHNDLAAYTLSDDDDDDDEGEYHSSASNNSEKEKEASELQLGSASEGLAVEESKAATDAAAISM